MPTCNYCDAEMTDVEHFFKKGYCNMCKLKANTLCWRALAEQEKKESTDEKQSEM